MKIYVAHLDSTENGQEFIQAPTEAMLKATIISWARINHPDINLNLFDEVQSYLTDHSEDTFCTGEIEIDISRTHFTEMECETAQIIWEVMLDMNGKEPINNAEQSEFGLMFDKHGSYGMRCAARDLARQIEEQWEAIDVDVKDGITFDWELVPAILYRTVWLTDVGSGAVPAGVVLEEVQKLQANNAA